MENLDLIETVLKRCARTGVTPMLWGKHGIGKSQIIRAIFEGMGYEVVDLRLGQMEVGDLIGHPSSNFFCPNCKTNYGMSPHVVFCPVCELKSKKIPIIGEMVWLPPSWFPQDGKKRLLFFDELNRGRPDVQQAVFQIVLDRRLHTNKLPDNCAIICASNPPASDSGNGQEYNVEELDPALLDRFVNIKFSLTTKNWLKWAREKNIMMEIIDFISVDERFLGNENVDIPIEIKPSPRSYEFLNKLLKEDKFGDDIPRKDWTAVAECILGSTAAIAFVQSLKTDLDKPVKAIEVFNNFKGKIKARVQKQVEAESGTRFDLLRVTLDEIVTCLAGEKSKDYTDVQLNSLADFLLMLPHDLLFSVLKDLSANSDITTRMLLPRQDLFKLLRDIRGKK